MKKVIITIALLLLAFVSFSQELNGRYKCNEEYINFDKGSADFEIRSGGCVYVNLKGMGTYEIIDSFLLIHTKDYTLDKSKIHTDHYISDTNKIFITDMGGKSLNYVTIEYLDSLDYIIESTRPDKNGFAIIPKLSEIKKILAIYEGQRPLIFNYKPNTNYNVSLEPDNFIENKIVVLKIYSINKDSFTTALITTNFKDGKDKPDRLKNLEDEDCYFRKEDCYTKVEFKK